MPVLEEQVGIKCFISSLPGFNGILKHRYTDFKVNEVDLSGNIARLSNLEAPPEPTDDSAPASIDDVPKQYAAITGTTDAAVIESIKSFLQQAQAHSKDRNNTKSPDALVLGPFEDKDQRRKVHQLFKLAPELPQCVTSTETGADGTSTFVHVSTVSAFNKQNRQGGNQGQGQKRKRDNRREWPGGACKYVKFALYKENTDSHHALTSLSKALHVGPKLFSVAGTKDKRAVTVQFVTVFNVLPSKLAQANTSPMLRGAIKVGNFEYVKEQLRLGDLSGNRFEIVLRGIDSGTSDGDGSIVKQAAESLKSHGFINYFGLQRFGSSDAVPTHALGRSLLRGEWQEAVKMILTPSSECRPEIREACEAYLIHNDIKKALSKMPFRCVGERTVLQALNQPDGSTNFLKALLAVPRNLRTMYIHAYQSYLWNEAASARISLTSDKVIVGDLVITRKHMQSARAMRAAITTTPTKKDGGDVDEDGDDDGDEPSGVDAEFAQAHVVTEQDVGDGVYSIEDVVLPLPGHQVVYPENSIKDVYYKLASADGIDLDASSHKVKEFSIIKLAGAYRHIMYRPHDFEYSVFRYDDPNVELVETDLMVVENKKLPVQNTSSNQGKYLGLKMAFTLPSSCYATMLIRELTKMDTGKEFAKNLPQSEQPAAAAVEGAAP